MKRTFFCWMAALLLSFATSPAEEAAKKQPEAAPKAPEPAAAKPAVPSVPTPAVPTPGKPVTAPAKEVAVIKTSMGEMVLEFWPEVAPKHVENFKLLARKGFYDGTAFHRVIAGFVIQGGNPNTKDKTTNTWPDGGPGYQIKAEINDRKHTRGVLSMARLPSGLDTAGSQFFICLADAPHLDGGYTGFGKLIKGEDVLMRIGATPTGPRDVPVMRVNVDSVKIVGIDTIK